MKHGKNRYCKRSRIAEAPFRRLIRAFANLRLIQTEDQLVYFDARPNPTASPIQAWLEMAGGDKRQQEVAGQIRGAILSATGAGT